MRNEIFEKFIEDLKINAVPDVNISMFLENEPLLDPYLFNKIDYIKNVMPKSRILLITNGILIHENYSNIVNSQIDNLKVSLDGYNAETFNIVHDTSITNEDWDNMVNTCNLLENNKKIEFSINRYYKGDKTPKEFLKYYFKSKDTNYTRGGILNHIEKTNHKKIKGCSKDIPGKWLNILADGSFILCCMDYTKSIVLGNIKHQTIREILDSDLYKTVINKANGIEDSRDSFICKNCEMAIPNE